MITMPTDAPKDARMQWYVLGKPVALAYVSIQSLFTTPLASAPSYSFGGRGMAVTRLLIVLAMACFMLWKWFHGDFSAELIEHLHKRTPCALVVITYVGVVVYLFSFI